MPEWAYYWLGGSMAVIGLLYLIVYWMTKPRKDEDE